MYTFQYLVEQVIALTVRPDMGFVEDGGDGRIPLAVAASLRTLHSKDFFKKDIATVRYIFPEANYVLELLTDALPRYRNLSYVRKWDPSMDTSLNNPSSSTDAQNSIVPNMYDGGGYQVIPQSLNLLTRIDPSDIFDGYHTEKQDIFYLAGSSIAIRSSTLLEQIQLGYFAYPEIKSADRYAATHTWMMDVYPDAIIQHAANWVFVQIGKQDVARAMTSRDGTLTEQIDNLMRSEATEVGV